MSGSDLEADGYFVSAKMIPVGDEIIISHGKHSKKAVVTRVHVAAKEIIVHFRWVIE